MFNSSRSEVLCKKGLLKNFTELTGKHLYWSLFLIKLQALSKADFNTGEIKKITYWFCEIFKNIFFIEPRLATASECSYAFSTTGSLQQRVNEQMFVNFCKWKFVFPTESFT